MIEILQCRSDRFQRMLEASGGGFFCFCPCCFGHLINTPLSAQPVQVRVISDTPKSHEKLENTLQHGGTESNHFLRAPV